MIRVRYAPTDLSEGVVDLLDADRVVATDDGRCKLQKFDEDDEKWYTVGYLAPGQWLSAVLLEEDV